MREKKSIKYIHLPYSPVLRIYILTIYTSKVAFRNFNQIHKKISLHIYAIVIEGSPFLPLSLPLSLSNYNLLKKLFLLWLSPIPASQVYVYIYIERERAEPAQYSLRKVVYAYSASSHVVNMISLSLSLSLPNL